MERKLNGVDGFRGEGVLFVESEKYVQRSIYCMRRQIRIVRNTYSEDMTKSEVVTQTQKM